MGARLASLRRRLNYIAAPDQLGRYRNIFVKTRLKSKEAPPKGKRGIDMKLLDLYEACLKNASALIKESELLLSKKHHARAYFLSYTAIEELGKSQVVADFSNEMVAESEFEAAFRDHKFKAAYVKRYVQIPNDLNGDWFIEYDKKAAAGYAQARHSALYVECLPDHSPKPPEESISHEAAERLLTTAKNYLSEIIRMEYVTERIGTKAFTK